MDEIERAELEAERQAWEDFLREGRDTGDLFMSEIERDHEEQMRADWLASLSPEDRAAHDAKLAEANARLEEAESHGIDMDDGVPF